MTESVVEILEKYGWTQGSYNDDEGKHCFVGAVWEALGYMECVEYATVNRIALQAVLIVDPGVFVKSPSICSAEGWNDYRGRSYEEVLLAAKHADSIIVDEFNASSQSSADRITGES